jgi:hypothetical protein
MRIPDGLAMKAKLTNSWAGDLTELGQSTQPDSILSYS